ncbi:hypothetical protein QU38_00040, partial [Staphylococcus aureus]
HRDDGGDVEGRPAKVKQARQRDGWTGTDLREVGHAERERDHRAEHHGKQDRQSRDRGTAELAQQQHEHKRDGREADIGHAAEIRRVAVAAHRPAGGDRHQGETDGGDDDAGDQRRKEADDPREHRR